MKRLAVLLSVSLLATMPAANALPDPPVLHPETRVGSIVTSATAPVAPTAKVTDGDPSDWTGEITRLGGTSIHSHGELVYQDYVNDAWGADDGFDAERLETLHAAKEAEPRTYRVDALQQAAGAQFGADRPVGADLSYGDTSAPGDLREQADIEEVRVAADSDDLHVLVRTLRMDEPVSTAVLILLDTEPGGSYDLPRFMGGITTGAEKAFLVSGTRLMAFAHKDLIIVTGGCVPPCESPVRVASDPSGFVNTLEVAISREAYGLPSEMQIGVATGVIDDPAQPSGLAPFASGDAVSDLVNVAFRTEPARIWMDEAQALALRTGSIDQWLAAVDLADLEAGRTDTFQQRPGYYERIYVDHDTPVNEERTTNSYFQGPYQHYGLYLPKAYRPGATLPATFWMHYRGGHAHDAAAWEPGILTQFGDETGGIVVTPSARGTSSWYTGRGMVDFLDAWDDAMANYDIDDDRVYLAGHSMGGWASYLLGILFPDRWAASNPQDGLVVPGLWTGVGEPSGPQQGADIEAQFLYPLLENTRNLPYAIMHGTLDELVPVGSAVAVGNRMHELGHRYRLYLFHAYEHYSAPIWDEWREMIRYMTAHTRDRDPARVTYKIRPALDHAVSTVSVPDGVDLGLRFDSAYWVSDLRTREQSLDPDNIGEIDATSHGRGVPEVLNVPEVGTGGEVAPYTMHGQRWEPVGETPAANGFMASLTNLSTATLDLERMAIGTTETITAAITTDGPAQLVLTGTWAGTPIVDGADGATYDGTTLTLDFADAGTYGITISP